MARRRPPTGASVNLFPFLSILVSIIGCLTLIIVVINLMAMGGSEGQTPDEVVRAQEYLEIKKEKEDKQKELDKLRQQIENIIQQNRDSLADRDKLTMLKEMVNNGEEINAKRNELIAEFNLLQNTNKKLLEDQETLMVEIKKKEEEISKRKLPPKAAALQVRPSGSSANTSPYFVEVSATSIYIHRSLTKEPVAVPIASLAQSEEFINLLKAIASKPYNRLILLMRGNASASKSFNSVNSTVSSFNKANGTKIIPGRIPLPGEGKVDLRMFAKFLEP